MNGRALFMLSMILLGLGLVIGAAFALLMTVTESWIWIIPAFIGMAGAYQIFIFFVDLSDTADDSKQDEGD